MVAKTLIRNKITISTAESCTGGLISDRLTNVPGVSSVYIGGLVAYSNIQKINLLEVKEKTLLDHGAVSEKTAIEMAVVRGKGLILISGSPPLVLQDQMEDHLKSPLG